MCKMLNHVVEKTNDKVSVAVRLLRVFVDNNKLIGFPLGGPYQNNNGEIYEVLEHHPSGIMKLWFT